MAESYYPVSLDLRGRTAVVIADGLMAESKAASLLQAGARVVVVSEQPTAAVEALAAKSAIELRRRAYVEGDLRGAFLAISAPVDRALNRAVWREAEAEKVLLNAVDDVEHCHFIAPSIHREGPVTVAVSTGGTSPALAVRLREAVSRIVRKEHGRLAALLGAMRPDVARRVPDAERRKRLWFDAADSSALSLIARGREAEAQKLLDDLVARAEAGESGAPVAPRRGLVTLVGAGPGRAGLITVEGLRALRRADAVVYDRLVHPSLLRAAPAHARRLYVGKQPHGPSVSQEQINDTLISLAHEGLRVVRLKGGDPFVFGRGAEECAALRAAGLRVRVVPGISSAIAAPGAAGIPVTHRDHASAFVVVTGEQAAQASPLDWDAIARIPTIVVMMGARRVGAILARLAEHGVDLDTPAAIVAGATLARQRTIVGSVATLADRAAAAGLVPPATLIVGDVVRVLGSGQAALPSDTLELLEVAG